MFGKLYSLSSYRCMVFNNIKKKNKRIFLWKSSNMHKNRITHPMNPSPSFSYEHLISLLMAW